MLEGNIVHVLVGRAAILCLVIFFRFLALPLNFGSPKLEAPEVRVIADRNSVTTGSAPEVFLVPVLSSWEDKVRIGYNNHLFHLFYLATESLRLTSVCWWFVT